jgi:hypothetical protein
MAGIVEYLFGLWEEITDGQIFYGRGEYRGIRIFGPDTIVNKTVESLRLIEDAGEPFDTLVLAMLEE